MAKLSKDEFLKAIEEMSVLELSNLVHAIEEKFGVSAAPMAAAASAGASSAEAKGEDVPEQTTFNVVLTEIGANKIAIIKVVRELVPTLGLQEAKTLVESAPKEVLTGVNKKTAQEAKEKLEKGGAKADLK